MPSQSVLQFYGRLSTKKSVVAYLVPVVEALPVDKRGAHVKCETRQITAPGISRSHRWELPDEEHDPVFDAWRLFVSQNGSSHTFQFVVRE
jgi:hypothetical protein